MQHSFNALGVSAAVEQALAALDIVEPFRIQSLVLPDALAGRDVLAKAPTGSGKTIAFGIPLVERVTRDGKTPEALVLVPTRELALQVAEAIETFAAAKGIRVGVAYGGAPVGSQAKRLKGAHIVVATPGRLQDLVERKMISLDHIKILVLDEADRMLDMGFKPQVERIVRRIPTDRQTMLFSATLDGDVGELAHAYTSDPSTYEVAPRARERGGVIEHEFVSVTHDGKVDTLIELLGSEDGLSLVFVRTKRGADRLAPKLNAAASTSSPCTATWASHSASAHSRGSARDAQRRSSRRMSPHAASTSKRSPTSSISTRPRTTRATCIASDGPAVPVAPAAAARSSFRISRTT